MPNQEVPDKCIDGARYRFVPDQSGGTPTGETGAEAYLAQILALLASIHSYLTAWQGVIISNEVVVPPGAQRKRYRMNPPPRTIRIESDSPAQIWLNDERGMAIPIGGDRGALYLSDLPPQAAIHDIYVTVVGETHLFILGVA